MKYPIGIQSFEDLRTTGCIYVDKTALVYKLTDECKYVFLGRPRRFGKSLLMSTIQAYFEGRKDLFEGLAIENLATDWNVHPVLHLDLNIGNFSSVEGLMDLLDNQLSRYENIYGCNPLSDAPQFRLQWLIQRAHELTGKKAVILIDEYDKPVINAIGNDELDRAFRNILKPFFGTLKSEDAHIRFAMLTGVSKFGKLSVFSDLNNIEDISLNKHYATICGLTEDEILRTFNSEIDAFAEEFAISREQMTELLRKKYDGYRFSPAKKLVFNPFSLLNSLKNKALNDYWFESGTPTFLVNLLRNNNYDLTEIDKEETDEDSLYQVDNINAVSLLYQSGYLTIKDYDREWRLCKLGFPNQEVKAGFLNFLVPYYSSVPSNKSMTELNGLVREIRSGDVEAFMLRMQSIFYSIPYTQDNSMKMQEAHVRNLIFLIFKLLGIYIQVECPMSKGRSDAIVCVADHVYIIEFKVDSNAEVALQQIKNNGYAKPYRADGRQITLIGVNYSTEERGITEWLSVDESE